MLQRLGLGDLAFRQYQRWQARVSEPEPALDGPPLPPPYLRVLTAGSPDPESFVRLGRTAAETVLALVERHGGARDQVLEFGVGCGRVARWLIPQVGRFAGCDVNSRLLGWSRANLTGEFARNRLTPPLGFADRRFDLVYALSVFTHMHDANARAWLAELARVTRPGGLAVLSFFDARLPQSAEVSEALGQDGFAIRQDGAEGSNLLCGYFSDQGLAERAAPHWTLAEVVGSDVSGVGQAWAVFRRA